MSDVQVLAYIPVLHRGYLELIAGFADAEVLLLGASFAQVHPAVRKDVRALPADTIRRYLTAVDGVRSCRVVEVGDLPSAVDARLLVVADDEVCREVVRQHRFEEVRDVRYETAFLRWDRDRTLEEREVVSARHLPSDQFVLRWSRVARSLGEESSDWWRRVGAVAVRDDEAVAWGRNRHQPTDYSPYVDGDPRSNFGRGTHQDLGTAIHAEAALVAQAAREGTSLQGVDLFVSTFPCPTCARLVAAAGVARVLYMEGYSMLDGEGVLAAAGVDIVHIEEAIDSTRESSS